MIKNSYFAPRIDYKTCLMFEQNGMFGVKDKDGNVVEEPIYDQVEFCEKYLYMHKDNHYKKYWYTGGSTEGPELDDDYTFIAWITPLAVAMANATCRDSRRDTS